jgi:hypothetical protein
MMVHGERGTHFPLDLIDLQAGFVCLSKNRFQESTN